MKSDIQVLRWLAAEVRILKRQVEQLTKRPQLADDTLYPSTVSTSVKMVPRIISLDMLIPESVVSTAAALDRAPQVCNVSPFSWRQAGSRCLNPNAAAFEPDVGVTSCSLEIFPEAPVSPAPSNMKSCRECDRSDNAAAGEIVSDGVPSAPPALQVEGNDSHSVHEGCHKTSSTSLLLDVGCSEAGCDSAVADGMRKFGNADLVDAFDSVSRDASGVQGSERAEALNLDSLVENGADDIPFEQLHEWIGADYDCDDEDVDDDCLACLVDFDYDESGDNDREDERVQAAIFERCDDDDFLGTGDTSSYSTEVAWGCILEVTDLHSLSVASRLHYVLAGPFSTE